MISYRFKRRAFLTAVGGGIGLKVMLRNMEASAQTASSPPRLLVTHWPVGIVPGLNDALWKPTSGAATGSPGLQPFVTNGLNNDMIVVRGVSTGSLNLNGGGSHEGGTVVLVTGVGCAGTRTNRGESDDGYAGGPSYDQLMLQNVAALKSPMGGAGGGPDAHQPRVEEERARLRAGGDHPAEEHGPERGSDEAPGPV